jgi:N6-L-threonylcarbamoyladenine synthase
MIVLGIETSCDDTALALYSAERGVIAESTASQLMHRFYGGVVPEIASRAHIRTILPVFGEVLAAASLDRDDIDGIGVSNGPGLIGSLLIGVGFAKALAYGLGIPVVGIHHIESHVFSNELEAKPMAYPCVVLVVSGGHTCLYLVRNVGDYALLGSTRDDAAGEAFDKIGKLLGLAYPGGPAIEKEAKSGNPETEHFPRAMMSKGNFDFSFSGLKTAVRLYVEKIRPLDSAAVANVAACAQEAIVDVLVEKTVPCAVSHDIAHVYLAGGVASNLLLRERMESSCKENGITFHAPSIRYCTDNGAMVACAALKHLTHGRDEGLSLDVFARGEMKSWLA